MAKFIELHVCVTGDRRLVNLDHVSEVFDTGGHAEIVVGDRCAAVMEHTPK